MPLPPATIRTLDQLTRAELCARIFSLRRALDALWTLTEMQGAEPYTCIGKMKVCLIELEQELRTRDRGVLAFVSGTEPQRASA